MHPDLGRRVGILSRVSSRVTIRALLVAACAWTVLASAAVAPCESPAHRQFDFWVGRWHVRTPDGKLVGTNVIEREYEGCVIHERYATGGAYRGESLNVYDAPRGVWHQSWVDSTGLLLLLEGGLRDGRMILEGRTTRRDGRVTRHRVTWTPNADGSVRQHWESADDSGAWTTAFDGTYTRL
ncbi:MAG: hypothetical protein ABI920_10870 [Casimicrobiaceae bacterium]